MIRRCEHSADKKFTLISRPLAQDDRLSFQARGLLLYILSKPGNWKAHYEDLRKQGNIGRTALDNIIKELRESGYALRHRERGEDGKLQWVMEIFEEPQNRDQCTPTSTGTSVRPPRTGKRALAIDSTGARAGSSVDLKRSKEITPSGYKVLPKEPEPKTTHPPEAFQIQEWMRTYLAERFMEFSEAELVELTDSWELARKADSEKRRTLDQWQYDWLRYMCATWQNRQTNGHKQGKEEEWDYHSALVPNEKPVDYFEKISAQYQKQ